MTGRDPVSTEAPSRMELLVSYVLRAGVLLGTALIVVGVVQMARTGQTGYASVSSHSLGALLAFAPPGSPGHFPVAPVAIFRAAVIGKPDAIIALGLLVLIATPALRVAVSVGFFIAERDRFYVVATLLVLAVLVVSFLLGAG
jgi:uncharacterized membrane protein